MGERTLDIASHGVNLKNSANTRELARVSVDFFRRAGFERMSYHHFPPGGAIDQYYAVVINTYGFPDAWVAEYIKRRYHNNDPIIRLAGELQHAFLWSECKNLGKLSPAEEHYLDRLAHSEIGDGYAVPVDGPHGRRAYIGLGFGDQPTITDPGFVAQLQAASYLGHCRYCELLEAQLPQHQKLSPREVQALGLMSQGMSNAEIAAEMNVSANTAGTLVQRIFQKLDVHDRVSAVMRGTSVGLIPWDMVSSRKLNYSI
ncbi:MAG: LuxR family transcriptional regulator [Pseudomonadota bacterium]